MVRWEADSPCVSLRQLALLSEDAVDVEALHAVKPLQRLEAFHGHARGACSHSQMNPKGQPTEKSGSDKTPSTDTEESEEVW